MDLLELLGYELNTSGDYVYRHTTSQDEIDFRENVAGECQRFSNDLKKIKAGNLPGFTEFLTVRLGMYSVERFVLVSDCLETL